MRKTANQNYRLLLSPELNRSSNDLSNDSLINTTFRTWDTTKPLGWGATLAGGSTCTQHASKGLTLTRGTGTCQISYGDNAGDGGFELTKVKYALFLDIASTTGTTVTIEEAHTTPANIATIASGFSGGLTVEYDTSGWGQTNAQFRIVVNTNSGAIVFNSISLRAVNDVANNVVS